MGKETVQEIKPKGLTRREFLTRAGAAALGMAAGALLPDSPEKAKAGAPVGEVQYKYKAFVPRAFKDISGQKLEEAERPPWPAEFGAPERGVILFNRGVEKGVKIGDQQLFENLMYLRKKYGRPDLKLEIYFYDSVAQKNILSGTNPYDLEHMGISNYDLWASRVPVYNDQGDFIETKIYPPTFKPTGVWNFKLGNDGGLEFHISLPELREGGSNPAKEQIVQTSILLATQDLRKIFMADESGRPNPSIVFDNSDLSTHPEVRRGQPPLLIIMK